MGGGGGGGGVSASRPARSEAPSGRRGLSRVTAPILLPSVDMCCDRPSAPTIDRRETRAVNSGDNRDQRFTYRRIVLCQRK